VIKKRQFWVVLSWFKKKKFRVGIRVVKKGSFSWF